MKRTLLFLILIATLPLVAPADDAWVTDFTQAKELAAENGSLILIQFTNSGLGGWCTKLDTLTKTAAFDTFAKKHLTRLLVDLPDQKEFPEDVTALHKKMVTDYHVRRIPTLVVTDATGAYLFQVGYKSINAEAYVRDFKKMIEKSTGKRLK